MSVNNQPNNAISTPMSANAISTPMSANAISTPMSANAISTPMSAYAISTPTPENATSSGESKTSILTPNSENAPENSTSDNATTEEKLVLTDDENLLFRKFRQMMKEEDEKEDLVVNANAIILEESSDIQLGGLDILLCPERLPRCVYFHGLIAKVVEYYFLVMIALDGYDGTERMSCVSAKALSVNMTNFTNTTFPMNSTFQANITNSTLNKTCNFQFLPAKLRIMIFIFFCLITAILCRQFKNDIVLYGTTFISDTGELFMPLWSRPGLQVFKLVVEVTEILILLVYSILFMSTSLIRQSEGSIDFIVNALGLLFIAEVDEMIISFISKSDLHYIILAYAKNDMEFLDEKVEKARQNCKHQHQTVTRERHFTEKMDKAEKLIRVVLLAFCYLVLYFALTLFAYILPKQNYWYRADRTVGIQQSFWNIGSFFDQYHVSTQIFMASVISCFFCMFLVLSGILVWPRSVGDLYISSFLTTKSYLFLGKRISDIGMEKLAEALPGSKLENLSIKNNKISDIGVEKLAEALPGSQLKYLYLNNNQISDIGTEKLAEALPASKLKKLYLHHTNISDIGAEKLAEALPGSELEKLILNYNEITDIGVQKIAEALPGSKLELLYLKKNNITDIGAENLAQALACSKLKKLSLSKNKITDIGAEKLAEALPGSKLEKLDLGNNKITDIGAEKLAEALPSSNLEHIYLYNNNITDIGAEKLKKAAKGQKDFNLIWI